MRKFSQDKSKVLISTDKEWELQQKYLKAINEVLMWDNSFNKLKW
jgi:hypothetical protein